MTVEEKLKYFTQTAMEESEQQAQSMLDDYKAVLDEGFKKHQEGVLQKADLEIKYETERIRHEGNKNLAKEHLQIRRTLIKKNTELTNKIFDEVDTLLEAYKKSTVYDKLLIKQLNDARTFAKGEEMICYLDPADAGKKASLEKITDISLTISEESFGGGIRALLPSRNILIDNSFSSKLSDAREHFRFSGGNVHDN